MKKENSKKLESVYQKILEKVKVDPSFLERLEKGQVDSLEEIGIDKDEKQILESLKSEISNRSSSGKISDMELEKIAGGVAFIPALIHDFFKIITKGGGTSRHSCH